MMVSFVEHHHLPLLGTPAKLLPAALAEAFDQHLKHFSLVFLVLDGGHLRLQGNQFIQASDLLFLRDIVGQMLRSIRSGTFGVFEHEGRVVPYLPHQAQRQLMVFFCLVVIAHEDIRRQSTVGNDTADGSDTVEIPFPRVLTVHQLQYLVRPALDRQVYLFAYIGFLGNDMQRLVTHILRMGSGEPHAHLRNLTRHKPEKTGEVDTGCIVGPFMIHRRPIRIHVLSEKCHLLEATVAQVAYLTQNALHITAPLSSTGIGHDAIMTEVVASAHDAHKAANLLSDGDTLGNDVTIGLRRRQLDVHCLLP